MKRVIFAVAMAVAAAGTARAEGDSERGEALFTRNCASCHTPEAAMRRCMMLTDYQAEMRLEGFLPMHRDTKDDQIADLIAYLMQVRSAPQ